MLSVIYAAWEISPYDKCYYAKCGYSECRGAYKFIYSLSKLDRFKVLAL